LTLELRVCVCVCVFHTLMLFNLPEKDPRAYNAHVLIRRHIACRNRTWFISARCRSRL